MQPSRVKSGLSLPGLAAGAFLDTPQTSANALGGERPGSGPKECIPGGAVHTARDGQGIGSLKRTDGGGCHRAVPPVPLPAAAGAREGDQPVLNRPDVRTVHPWSGDLQGPRERHWGQRLRSWRPGGRCWGRCWTRWRHAIVRSGSRGGTARGEIQIDQGLGATFRIGLQAEIHVASWRPQPVVDAALPVTAAPHPVQIGTQRLPQLHARLLHWVARAYTPFLCAADAGKTCWTVAENTPQHFGCARRGPLHIRASRGGEGSSGKERHQSGNL